LFSFSFYLRALFWSGSYFRGYKYSSDCRFTRITVCKPRYQIHGTFVL
jgi:hypothetical protein